MNPIGEFLARIVITFQPLTILIKSSILDLTGDLRDFLKGNGAFKRS